MPHASPAELSELGGQAAPTAPVRPVVVVPAFNHARAVTGVLDRCAALGLPLIVVNDGSTDATLEVLGQWAGRNTRVDFAITTHLVNLGKAAALRTGFAAARSRLFTHAVTIDADGQHEPDDVPHLLREAMRFPKAIVLGTRPLTMENCPRRCAIGRKQASLAVRLQTGLRLSDTQCGLRVYPLTMIEKLRCGAERYSFEAEIITRAAWAGIGIREVPVRCRYFLPQDRVSHWRPFVDSLRQTAVHLRLFAESFVAGSHRGQTEDACAVHAERSACASNSSTRTD
jgi:glycosyltransferase involved in cell wall biosynthesis